MSQNGTAAAPNAEALAALLAPYADPDPAQCGRLLDVPAMVGRAALEYLPADVRESRLNGTGPAMTWLTARAAEWDGRLVGSLAAGRTFVRFDGIQVLCQVAQDLARQVATEVPGALENAVAEAWPSWTAQVPTWTGTGLDVLDGRLPSDAAICGLWWD